MGVCGCGGGGVCVWGGGWGGGGGGGGGMQSDAGATGRGGQSKEAHMAGAASASGEGGMQSGRCCSGLAAAVPWCRPRPHAGPGAHMRPRACSTGASSRACALNSFTSLRCKEKEGLRSGSDRGAAAEPAAVCACPQVALFVQARQRHRPGMHACGRSSTWRASSSSSRPCGCWGIGRPPHKPVSAFPHTAAAGGGPVPHLGPTRAASAAYGRSPVPVPLCVRATTAAAVADEGGGVGGASRVWARYATACDVARASVMKGSGWLRPGGRIGGGMPSRVGGKACPRRRGPPVTQVSGAQKGRRW